MSSFPIRDPQTDHLLTPQNATLVIIDFQPTQIESSISMNRQNLVKNILALATLCLEFKMPIVLTTVGVQQGSNKPTIPPLANALKGVPTYDRTSINSWEDEQFRAAVIATNRKKIIMAALWTEACLSFPTLDMLREDFEIYPVVDATAGTSQQAYKAALSRVVQAGAKLTSVVQVACELQRDWNRNATNPIMVKALTAMGAFLPLEA